MPKYYFKITSAFFGSWQLKLTLTYTDSDSYEKWWEMMYLSDI